MLISFEVGNHRSIAEPQKVSFVARQERLLREQVVETDVPTAPRLTRVQALFGENGAGKSNLMSALGTLQQMVLQSMTAKDVDYEAWYAPNQSPSWGDQPTSLGIEILIDGVRYAYTVAFDARYVTFEQLLVYKAGKAQRWFHRARDATGHAHWEPFSSMLHGQREVWRQATRERALFLTTAAQLNATDLIPLAQWFRDRLLIVRTTSLDIEAVANSIADVGFKAAVLSAVQSAAPDVADVRIVWREVSSGSQFPKLEIQFAYDRAGLGRVWLGGDGESTGRTQHLILATHALSALKDGRCLCIDDFDAGLHPVSGRHLLRLIAQGPSVGPDTAQLLFTSRSPALLDDDLLRRDELNIVERRLPHASSVRSFASDESLRRVSQAAADFGRGSVRDPPS